MDVEVLMKGCGRLLGLLIIWMIILVEFTGNNGGIC
jgi:hypothetical protein